MKLSSSSSKSFTAWMLLSSAASCVAFVPAPALVPRHNNMFTTTAVYGTNVGEEVSSLLKGMLVEAVTDAEKQAKEAVAKMEQAKKDLDELNQAFEETAQALSDAQKEVNADLQNLVKKKLEEKVTEVKNMDEWKELKNISDEAYDEINEQLVKLTGDDNFKLDDVKDLVTKKIVDISNKAQEVNIEEDLLPLLKTVSSFGFPLNPYVIDDFSLPFLVNLYNLAAVEDAIADQITGTLAIELDKRAEEVFSMMTEKDVEELGNVFKDEIKAFTGKDTYEFGDITRTAIDMLESEELKPDVVVIGVADDTGSSTIVVPLKPELQADLEALEEVMEEDKSEKETSEAEEA